MGQPKKQRRLFQRPKKPYDKERIANEKKILKEFGLRTKQEIWKAESLLRKFRRRARVLLANPDEKIQKELFGRLNKIGIGAEELENVLALKPEDVLARRLQTIVYKKRIGSSMKQARQLICHRHIIVNGRKVGYPSYLVKVNEEDKIEINPKIREKLLALNKVNG